jgi:hypothetical protein
VERLLDVVAAYSGFCDSIELFDDHGAQFRVFAEMNEETWLVGCSRFCGVMNHPRRKVNKIIIDRLYN